MKTQSKNTVITVAFADDHVSVRKGIISYLHDLGGINVTIEADNGKELLRKIDQSKEKPDICMLDIKMPVMNGFETVSNLSGKKYKMKTLILSTFTEDVYIVRMIRAGVNGYLSKSCDPEEIKTALLSIRNEGFYYSDLYMRKAAIAAQENKIRIPNFTEKERLLLRHCCSDKTYAEISMLMNCTVKSVEGYRDSLFRKLNINNRVSLALFAVKTGFAPVESGVPYGR